jgi:hypothetical protein
MKCANQGRRGGEAEQAPAASPRRWTVRRAAAALSVVAFGPLGCGIGLTASPSEGFTAGDALATPPVDAAAAGADAGITSTGTPPVIDAGTADAATHMAGSPLCGIGTTADAGASCSPDEGVCTPAPGGVDAAAAAIDAARSGSGGSDGGVAEPDAESFACRVTVTRAEAGAASAVAACTVAGTGRAEAVCHASSDCAPGFDCVVNAINTYADGASTTGVCRHYCCDNSCEASNSFCDIESTLGGSASVPVCVPQSSASVGAACVLLDDMTCGTGLSCQVVNANTGEVACVTPGSATAGDSCETAKCADGLSCIGGYFPNRQCVQLCNHDNDNCPPGDTCTADPALSGQNAAVGICTP